MATRKTVFRVRNLVETSSIGSKGCLVRAFKTNDRSQGGVVTLLVSSILSVLINLAIHRSKASGLLKKELRVETCTLSVAGLNPLYNPCCKNFKILATL